MNRLNKQRVYLAGAMDRVADRGATWRDNITPFLQQLGIVVFNPINKPADVGLEDQDSHTIKTKLKAKKRYDELSSMMKTIRAVDLRLVDISDFLIVNLAPRDFYYHLVQCGFINSSKVQCNECLKPMDVQNNNEKTNKLQFC